MFTVKSNTEYLLEKDYDGPKVYTLAGEFDKTNPDHYANGSVNRTSVFFTEKEAQRFNNLVDGDGSCQHIGIIVTSKGLRFKSY